jgi:hypothetical protein
MTDSLKIPEKNSVPKTASARIAEILKLSLKEKEAFVPPVGQELKIGPYIYKVKMTNVGQLRFSCTLYDVIIEGVNDTEAVIISPHTGKVVGK